MKTNEIYTIILLTATILSCRNDDLLSETDNDELEQPIISDWSETTHGILSQPNYSTVFNQSKVLRFDIKIDNSDWETMQADLDANLGSSNSGGGGPRGQSPGNLVEFDPVWVPCSFTFNDTEWYKVGIRYKGNSSLNSTYSMGINKYSFKLDFEQFEDDYPVIENQRFYGFKQLNLKNNYADPSMMREKVVSDIFLDFGLASPQTTFCVVYVDYGSGSQYYGVYTLVEEVDDTVLESLFKNNTGNLYKPDGDAASFASGSYNDSEMEKKNNIEAPDYSDVIALYNTINNSERTSSADKWKTDLGNVFDVNIFLKWLAANTVMQNWDTYGQMTHNYYLYNNPDNNLLTWIPWDNNEALQDGKQAGSLSLSLDEVTSDWPLIRYIMDEPEYKAIYEEFLLRFIEDSFSPDEIALLYAQYSDLLKEHAYAELSGYSFLNYSNEFDEAVETLKSHVQNRNNAVLNYLE